ncbi:excisionase family DNA-binding protein [Methylobacterium komagatae]|uniref:Excisionase family DNA-binding protein n=1 Tax=Methylobacterium komagatae TaxID=374425 RepID=A0ABW2BSF2_9HYPH
MATLSLREAAEQTGVSKSTIFRAIKSGRMSAPRNDDGEFLIDPAELFRVYPPKAKSSENPTISGDVPAQPETHSAGRDASDHETVELRIRNAALEAELKGLRAMADELRQARDKWESQAERLTLALAAPKPVEAPAPVAEAVAPRSWWPFRRAG